jgi:hypothetical protein
MTHPEFAYGLQAGSESFSDTYDADTLPTESQIHQVIREQISSSWRDQMDTVARLTECVPPSSAYRTGFLLGWIQAYTVEHMKVIMRPERRQRAYEAGREAYQEAFGAYSPSGQQLATFVLELVDLMQGDSPDWRQPFLGGVYEAALKGRAKC